MKKLLSTLLGSLFVAGTLFAFVYFGDQVRAYEPPAPDQKGDYAFLLVLDSPFTPAVISSKFYCPRQEARSGKLILSSFWMKTRGGKFVVAHVQSYNVGGGVGWAMLFTGPRHLVREVKDIVEPLNAVDTGPSRIAGPKDLAWLEGKSTAFCNKVARAFLIPLTGTLEGGALPPSPYTEGGSWPTAEVLTCADGTKYQLKTAMNGITLAREKWTQLPPETAEDEIAPGPRELLPCSATWSDPDAATTKFCPPIPVGSTCSK